MHDGVNFPYGNCLMTMPPEYVMYYGAAQIKRHKGKMCRYCKCDLEKNSHLRMHQTHDNGCWACYRGSQAPQNGFHSKR